MQNKFEDITFSFIQVYCPINNTTNVRYYMRPIAPRCQYDLFDCGWSDHEQLEVKKYHWKGGEQSADLPRIGRDIPGCHVPALSQVSTSQNRDKGGGDMLTI